MGHRSLRARRSVRQERSKWLEMEALEQRRLLSAGGVSYSYYEGSWSALPNFSTLTPIKSGLSHNFDLSIRNKDTNYGFKWTGNIAIPTTGSYTFYTGSDDGSELLIDGTQVVNNDGLHASAEHSGSISLSAGSHAITVEYFQATGGQTLTTSWAGPGISKQSIPDSVLTTTAPSALDVASYGAVGNGSTNDSTAIQNAINAAPDGATLNLDAGKTYLLGSGLVLSRPLNVEGNGATLLLDTSAYPQNETVSINSAVTGTIYTWTGTESAGQTTFNVSISTNVLVPGDTIFLQLGTDPNDNTQPQWGEVVQVTANTGSSITVNTPLPYAITSQGSQPNRIERITDVIQNNSFKDVNFNYVANTTPDTNIWTEMTRNLTLSNLTGQFTIMANVTDSTNTTISNCSGTLNQLESSSGRMVSAWQTDGLTITNDTATTSSDAPVVFLESWARNTTVSGLTVNWNLSSASSQDVFHFTGNSYNTTVSSVTINNVGAINLVQTGSQAASYSFGTVTVSGPIKSTAALTNISTLITGGATYAQSALQTSSFQVQVQPNWNDYVVPLCNGVVESMTFTLSNLTGVNGIYVINTNGQGSQLIGTLVAGQPLVLPQIFGSDNQFNDPHYNSKNLNFYTGSTVPAGTTLNVTVVYYPPKAYYINTGGNAIAGTPYTDDTGLTSPSTGTDNASTTVSTANVTNPMPQQVYQSERYGGNFSYTLGGFVAGTTHTVTLGFAECYWTAAGQRVFNVHANGTLELSNFDIFAAAGGANIAIDESFNVTADASGNITLSFDKVTDNAEVRGIEIV